MATRLAVLPPSLHHVPKGQTNKGKKTNKSSLTWTLQKVVFLTCTCISKLLFIPGSFFNISAMQHPHYISVGWFRLVIRYATRSAGEDSFRFKSNSDQFLFKICGLWTLFRNFLPPQWNESLRPTPVPFTQNHSRDGSLDWWWQWQYLHYNRPQHGLETWKYCTHW